MVRIPFWVRLLLVAFLIDIMLIYPVLNRVEGAGFANRILLLVMVLSVFVAFAHRWVATMTRRWDLATTMLMCYFLWIVLSTFGSIALGVQSASSIFTYGLNSFAPLILYGCFVRFPDRTFLVKVVAILTALNILAGAVTFAALGLNIPIVTETLLPLIVKADGHRLVSLVGTSTIVGYLSLFCFSWTLFFHQGRSRRLILSFFLIGIVLSFQRSMWGGLLMVGLIYFLSPGVSLSVKYRDVALMFGLILALAVVFSILADASAITKLLWDRFSEFNLADALSERSNQQQVFVGDSLREILFGQGYGKYSPLNKAENLVNLPDAPYHMILNETGVLGLGLFLSALAAFAVQAFVRGNYFQLWFVLHVGVVLIGSRLLWYFPLNFVIFMFLAILKNDRGDTMISNQERFDYAKPLHRYRSGPA